MVNAGQPAKEKVLKQPPSDLGFLINKKRFQKATIEYRILNKQKSAARQFHTLASSNVKTNFTKAVTYFYIITFKY